jgi:hypothetical protein
MKYATWGKLGGELIIADEADYDDYKGFLKCPIRITLNKRIRKCQT